MAEGTAEAGAASPVAAAASAAASDAREAEFALARELATRLPDAYHAAGLEDPNVSLVARLSPGL